VHEVEVEVGVASLHVQLVPGMSESESGRAIQVVVPLLGISCYYRFVFYCLYIPYCPNFTKIGVELINSRLRCGSQE